MMSGFEWFVKRVQGKLFHIFIRKGPFYKQWKEHDNLRYEALLKKCFGSQDEKGIVRLIAKWYNKKHRDKRLSEKEASALVESMAQKECAPYNGRVIVLAEFMSARFFKTVSALHRHGVHITMITCPTTMENAPDVRNMIKPFVDETIECSCVEEVLYTLMQLDDGVVHWYTAWWDLTYSWCALKAKALLGKKIVIDRYDILNGLFTGIPEELLRMERYVMENADGICNRSWEIPYLEKELHFVFKGKVIHFDDFIGNTECPPAPPEDEGRELELVYVGGVHDDAEDPDLPYSCFQEFAKICQKNKCHFHVYHSGSGDGNLTGLIEEDKNNPYFHLHDPVSFSELVKKMSMCDFSCAPCRKVANRMDVHAAFGTFTYAKMMYAAGNKFWDAIDAGIPVVGNPCASTDIAVSQGFGIEWYIDEYDFDELRKRRYEMRRNARAHRAEWVVDAHMGELEDFYRSL